MSPIFQLAIGGMGVVMISVIGVLTRYFPQENIGESFVRSVTLLNEARENCVSAVKQHLNTGLDYPGIANDEQTKAILTWKPSGERLKMIVCTYERDRGVTSLVFDDKEMGARQ